MSRISAANVLSSPVVPVSTVYVHLITGEVAVITPATDVVVQSHLVLVYDGERPVASYPRREVFSCSKTPISPSF